MTISTHLILVSVQPIPNLTPVLDDRTRPQKVIMLVSPDMTQRSQALEKIYKPRGIQIETYRVDDPWDAEKIGELVQHILDPYPEGSIALNATGGTKLMSIAACEVFRLYGQPIFYIHPEHDRLIWLSPRKPAVELADRIRIKDYLTAYGVEEINIATPFGVPEAIRKLGQWLIDHHQTVVEDLGLFNYLADQARTNLSVTIEHGPRAKPGLWALIDRFAEAGCCTLQGHNLKFKNEEARFLANGGWLEQYTYALCLNLKTQLNIQDIAANIKISRQPGRGATVKNEIDLGIINNNRLHLIECKTSRYQNGENKEADILYKLDSLRDLIGGLQGRAMLVSFNKPDAQTLARAKELDIQLYTGSELKQLQNHLQNWFTQRS